MLITKSILSRMNQCPKSLVLSIQSPELKTEDSDDYLLKQGQQIDLLARELFPGGTEIKYDPNDFRGMADRTLALIKEGVTTIYDATFMSYDFIVLVDIFHYDEGWRIYEVKSGTSVEGNQNYLDDVSFQMNVVQQIIKQFIPASLITLSRDYRKQKEISVHDMFDISDVSEKAKYNQRKVYDDICAVYELDFEKAMTIDIGKHCNGQDKGDSVCPFKSYCWSHNGHENV